MITNTYLYNKCCICGHIQIDDLIIDINNIFKFCLECKKIFCNNKLCLSLHKCQKVELIYITQRNLKCLNLSHYNLYSGNSYFTNFCIGSKKNICDYCFKSGHKGHIKDKRILTYNNEKRETEFLLKLIKRLKEAQTEISKEKILK